LKNVPVGAKALNGSIEIQGLALPAELLLIHLSNSRADLFLAELAERGRNVVNQAHSLLPCLVPADYRPSVSSKQPLPSGKD
jgi:hypothetical protein